MDNKAQQASEEVIETFSMKEFLVLCLGYWKWFLLSIVIFIGIGLFYAYTRQPVYERYEEILIKDQDGGGGIGDVANAFSGLGLFSSNTKVFNELISFTTPAIMFDVVDRLDLTMNYTHREGLKKNTLFGTNLPVVVDFPDLGPEDEVEFKLFLNPNGTFTLNKFAKYIPSGKVKLEGDASGKLNTAVDTPIGMILISPNPDYVDDGKEKEKMEIDVFKQSRLGTIEKYSLKLKGDLTDQDADVIKLSLEDTSIERANAILDLVVVIYNEQWVEDKNKVSVATSQFITERLGLIEKELEQVDIRISQLKSDMKLPDLELVAQGYVQQNNMINEQLLKTTNMLSMTKFLKDYLENPANQFEIVPMNTGIDNTVLEQQIGKYNDLLLARNNLLENASDDNPIVTDYTREITGLRAAIIRSVDSNISNLSNTIANINKTLDKNMTMLGKSPLEARSLLQVERQQKVLSELYVFLLEKREENELTQSFTADNIRIITPPYGKRKPISPKKFLIILVSFALGVGIPLVALYLAKSSDNKIRSKKDLENLPVPFAGEIPLVGRSGKLRRFFKTKKGKQKDIDRPKIVVAEGKRDIPNEAFRVVRSNIEMMLGNKSGIAIALTSFNPGSGKSFISYNLGASFALKHKKVLIIDGDLRHGSLSGFVGSPKKGLASYLSGSLEDWKSLVVPSKDFRNLSVLPIGHKPPNPAELLENGRLESLIEEAKEEYDIVIVDCPPVNIVVDTQIINQYVSRTIFVVRAGLFDKNGLRDIMRLVEEDKLKNVALMLNGTTTEFSSYHTYGNYEALEKI